MNDINNLLNYEKFKFNAESFARFAGVSFNIYDKTGKSFLTEAENGTYEELSKLFIKLAPDTTSIGHSLNGLPTVFTHIEFRSIRDIFLSVSALEQLNEDKLKAAASLIASFLKDSLSPRHVQCSNSVMLGNLFTAVEQSPISIVITDKYGNVEYVNPFFQELTGFTLEDLKGKNMRLLKSDDHDKEFYKNLWDTVLSGKAWTGKFINRKKDGSKYVESAKIIPIIENGEILRFVGIKNDITEMERAMLLQESSNQLLEATVKRRTEKLRNSYMQLKGNRDLLKKAQRVARMGGWARDLITGKDYWTDETFDLFGLERRLSSAPSPEEIISVTHPDDRQAVADWLESFFCFSEPKEFNFRIIRSDGEERIISSIYSYDLGEDGQPLRVNGIHHDRTESILYAQNLEKHEQMLNSILLAAGVGICVINKDGFTELINPEFRSIFGTNSTELLGLNLKSAFPAMFESPDSPKLIEALESKAKFYRTNYKVRSDNSKEKELILSIAHPGTEQDAITIVTASDVTELTDLHERQKAQEAMLIQQSKMAAMGEMIGVITHQWKQPLNAVSLLSQIIESEFKQSALNAKELHEYISNIYEQIDFMSQTIKDFTDFFKPLPQKIKFEAVSALKEIIELVSVHFANSSIRVDFNTSIDEVYTFGSKNELKQIILNLLSNAKDAILTNGEISNKGEICVTCTADPDEISISVADNGGGIPDKAMKNLFRSYFTTKDTKGTGIGLYISKLIAETKLQGTISAANKGSGAVFTLKIRRSY